MNEHHFATHNERASHLQAWQAALMLCARISARLYLALHPAGSLSVGCAVPVVVRCLVKNVYDDCSAVGWVRVPSPMVRKKQFL